MTAERYESLMKYMDSCMRDSAHDRGHIQRVLDAALMLARQEKNVNYDALIAAALLHDIGREEAIQKRREPCRRRRANGEGVSDGAGIR